MKKVKNTIPVYDICAINGQDHNHEIIAEPFASYLQAHPNLHRAHRHSFFHIVLFTAGSGYHTIDFEQFEVHPGQIYFMKPGQVHSWNFEGHVDGYVINFAEGLLDSLLAHRHFTDEFSFFQGIAADGVVHLPPPACHAARTTIAQIVTAVAHNEPMMREMVCALLVQLFITVGRSTGSVAPGATRPPNQLVLHNFRKLVDKHYNQMRLPKEYAAQLYITPNHLNALCKDLLGKPAGEVIRERIMLEARRLLVNATLSISDISDRLSFTDNSHFTKFFKKHASVTPEEFRRSALVPTTD